MISSEVQRTLVKSPPELWTELSDPAALARHLGDFGEIRITRVEPETTVEWEADSATGSVCIKPSGWGTRVTLKATREKAELEAAPAPDPAPPPQAPEPDASAPGDRAPQDPAREDSGRAAEPEIPSQPDAPDAPDACAEAEAAGPAQGSAAALAQWQAQAWEDESEPEPQPDIHPALEPYPEPRRGLLSRIFGWRRSRAATGPAPATPDDQAELELEPHEPVASIHAPLVWAASGIKPQAPAAWARDLAGRDPACQPRPDEASEPASFDTAAPEPGAPEAAAPEPEEPEPAEPEPSEPGGEAQEPDISAQLAAAEDRAAEEVRAVLTSMLDRLGTAHHRPFSRA